VPPAPAPRATETPTISVVLCTYNRALLAEEAVRRILTQDVPCERTFEVVAVDDGSTDDTSTRLRAITDPRLQLVQQANFGLSAARNAGIRVARGKWLVFVDDDDEPLPGWLSALSSFDSDPTCGIVTCSVFIVTGDKRRLARVGSMGPLFHDQAGVFLPGAFAVRRELLDQAGHFLIGLGTPHQFELSMRLITTARERGWRVGLVHEPYFQTNRSGPLERPLANPALMFDSHRWLLVRHASDYARARRLKARHEASAGVAAARCSRWSDARTFLLKSVRTCPWYADNWARLGLTLVPAIAKVAWRIDKRWAVHSSQRRGLPMEGTPTATLPASDQDRYFLPWRYEQNPVKTSAASGKEYWDGASRQRDRYQEPVYRWAARLIREDRSAPVVDVGCGTGAKLIGIVSKATDDIVGVDQAAAIEVARRAHPTRTWLSGDLGDPALWRSIKELRPALMICADVIEHVRDPRDLLWRMKGALPPTGRLLISTPDRSRMEEGHGLGPPSNEWHVREWTSEEFVLLLESCGFTVLSRRHLLPRSYAVSTLELKRLIARVIRLKPLPDPRRCMAFLVAPTT
jgi:glycosyltransferase involved in cell wall biosynthesis/SAM-dependent methyltransferase